MNWRLQKKTRSLKSFLTLAIHQCLSGKGNRYGAGDSAVKAFIGLLMLSDDS